MAPIFFTSTDPLDPDTREVPGANAYSTYNPGETAVFVRPRGTQATGEYVRVGSRQTVTLDHTESITLLEGYVLRNVKYINEEGQVWVSPGRLDVTEAYVSGTAPASGWTREDFAEAAGMPVARRGAYFGPDGAAYNYLTVPGVVTSGNGFTVRWKMAVYSDPADWRAIWARRGTGGWSFLVRADGEASLYENTGNNVSGWVAGLVPVDGLPHSYEVAVTATTYTIRRDGVEVASGTHANALATNGYVLRVGGSTIQWESADCTIWDWELEDADSVEDSYFLALDAPNASGGYDNTYTGSTMADAVIGSGTVLPVRINSVTPGSGVPICEGPVVASMARTSVQSMAAGVGSTVLLTADEDPYGWYDSYRLVVPVKGVIHVAVTGRARATANTGASTFTLRIRDDTTNLAQPAFSLDTVNQWVSIAASATAEVSAGAEIYLATANVTAGLAKELDDVTLTLTLYPDLS